MESNACNCGKKCKGRIPCWLGMFIIFFAIVGIYFLLDSFVGHHRLLSIMKDDTTCLVMAENLVSTEQLSQDLLVSTITDFYTTIITILTVIIGVLTAVGFIYLKFHADQEIEDQAFSIITKSELFKKQLEVLMEKTVVEELDSSASIQDIVESYGKKAEELEKLEGDIENCKKRLEYLEKIVNNKEEKIYEQE